MFATRDSPLSHIWLAANYDRKLTKTQFLHTNIIQSTQLITQEQSLRKSGQLLLGIVKIYSRKTKYLLDDVYDVLYKLKTSFKLGKCEVSVNLPVENTINLARVGLVDQVGAFGLLYQDDLNLDEEDTTTSIGGLFSQMEYDQSVEFPRYEEENPLELVRDEDGEEEFDFDLDVGMDDSVEIGRNISMVDDEREMSVLDVGSKDIFELDLGIPLQVDEEPPIETAPTTTAASTTPRIRRTGITEQGLITNKRKLIIDTEEELSIQTLRENQQALLQGGVTFNLNQQEKLKVVYELSMPVCNKRRRIDINEDLQLKSIDIGEVEEQEQEEPDYSIHDESLDFDLSLPDFEEVEEPQTVQELAEEIISENSTLQIAKELQTLSIKETPITLNELIDTDTIEKPLSSNPRKEATRCFFELLVLATNDCIELRQDTSDIFIKPRDRLYSQFV